jgi:hypothetical protein
VQAENDKKPFLSIRPINKSYKFITKLIKNLLGIMIWKNGLYNSLNTLHTLHDLLATNRTEVPEEKTGERGFIMKFLYCW